MNWSWINEYSWQLFALLIAVLIIVLRGFLGEAGKDLWAIAKPKIWPGNPDPKKVSRHFEAPDYPAGSCVWRNEDKVNLFLDDGYCHYLDAATDAQVYRVVHIGDGREAVEFLLVNPGAEKFVTSD